MAKGRMPLRLDTSSFKVVEFDHFMISDIRRLQEADFRRAATIAITSQPSALHRVLSWHYAADLTMHSFHTGFHRLVSGWAKEVREIGGIAEAGWFGNFG